MESQRGTFLSHWCVGNLYIQQLYWLSRWLKLRLWKCQTIIILYCPQEFSYPDDEITYKIIYCRIPKVHLQQAESIKFCYHFYSMNPLCFINLFNHFHHSRETGFGGVRTTEQGSQIKCALLPSQPWYTTEDRPQHRKLHARIKLTTSRETAGAPPTEPPVRREIERDEINYIRAAKKTPC